MAFPSSIWAAAVLSCRLLPTTRGEACRMYRRALKVCSKIPEIAWSSTGSMAAGTIQLSPNLASCDTGSEPGTNDTKRIQTFRVSSARRQFQVVERTSLRSFATGGMSSSKRPIPEKVQPHITTRTAFPPAGTTIPWSLMLLLLVHYWICLAIEKLHMATLCCKC